MRETFGAWRAYSYAAEVRDLEESRGRWKPGWHVVCDKQAAELFLRLPDRRKQPGYDTWADVILH